MTEQLYSLQGQEPEPLPEKVRLLDSGLTVRVREGMDQDLLLKAGWTGPYEKPAHDPAREVVEWNPKALEFRARKKTVPETLRENESLFAQLRVHRDELLRQSDVLVLRELEHGRPVSQALLDYRQALRDLPTVTQDPRSAAWPALNRGEQPQQQPADEPAPKRQSSRRRKAA